MRRKVIFQFGPLLMAAALLIGFGLGGGSPENVAAASAEGVTSAQPAQGVHVQVTGYGEVVGDPDHAVIGTAVEARGETPLEAQEAAQKEYQSVHDALLTRGIEFAPGHYSLHPRWEYRGEEGRVQDGYEARRQLEVTVRDLGRVGEVIQALLESGVGTISSVNYALADQSAVRTEAIQQALRDAREQADAVASEMGMEVAHVTEASLGAQGPPRVFGVMRAESAAASMDPSSVSVRANVTVGYMLQPRR